MFQQAASAKSLGGPLGCMCIISGASSFKVWKLIEFKHDINELHLLFREAGPSEPD